MSLPRTDNEWVVAIHKRDSSACEELSYTLYVWIYNYLRQLSPYAVSPSRAISVARECATDAIIRIFNRIDQYQQKGPFLGWCRVVALRTTKNWIRDDIQNRKREEYLTDEVIDSKESDQLQRETVVFIEEITAILNVFLESGLTEKERQTFLALANLDSSRIKREQIANELGMTRNNLDQTWYRVRRKTREYLEKSGYTEECLREYNLL